MAAIDHAERLLQRAAPGGSTTTGWDRILERDYARLDLAGTDSVKFAYLYSGQLVVNGARAIGERPGGLTLALYAGDTLTQARALYGDPDRVSGLLALRERGWELRPNFHFGYMEKGFIWTTSTLEIEAYARYWSQQHRLHAYPREEWDAELARLVADGIFSADHEPAFDADFRQTQRQQAYPRPTIAVTRSWDEATVRKRNFSSQRRAALREVLTALREPLATKGVAVPSSYKRGYRDGYFDKQPPKGSWHTKEYVKGWTDGKADRGKTSPSIEEKLRD